MKTVNDTVIWFGTLESANKFIAQSQMIEQYLANGVPESVKQSLEASQSGDEERFGEYAEFIRVENRTAIVPVQGSLRTNEDWVTRMFGIMTYETLSNIMSILSEDDGIDNILMDIDSPGGQAKGIDIASDSIKAVQELGKPVVSHTSGSMASAAYWIGSTGNPVQSSKNAEVGSVGVIAVHMDYSEMLKKEGITPTVLRKGEEKALATPYEKLSEEAKQQIDDSMERTYSSFIDVVAENIGLPSEFVRENIATGRVFSSEEAKNLGMVDEILTFNEAVSRLIESGDQETSTTKTTDWSKAAMHKKPIIKAGVDIPLSAEEAATAVAAGIPTEQLEAPENLQAEGTTGKAEGTTGKAEDTTGEAEDTTGEAEGTTGKAEDTTGEAEGSDGKEGDKPAEESSSSPATELISSLNSQLVEAQVKLNEANTQIAELKASNVGFRQMAIDQTQNMRVALGASSDANDMEKMTDSALMTAYQEARELYLSRFVPGATSRTQESDTAVPSSAVTRIDQAVRKATSIR